MDRHEDPTALEYLMILWDKAAVAAAAAAIQNDHSPKDAVLIGTQVAEGIVNARRQALRTT